MAARLADGTEAANLRTDSPPPTPSLSPPPPLHNPVAAVTTEDREDLLILRDEGVDTAIAGAAAAESIVALGVGLNLLVADGGGGGDDNGIGDSITNGADDVEQKKKVMKDEKTSDNNTRTMTTTIEARPWTAQPANPLTRSFAFERDLSPLFRDGASASSARGQHNCVGRTAETRKEEEEEGARKERTCVQRTLTFTVFHTQTILQQRQSFFCFLGDGLPREEGWIGWMSLVFPSSQV